MSLAIALGTAFRWDPMDTPDLVLGSGLRMIAEEVVRPERYDEGKRGGFGIVKELVASASTVHIIVSII